MDVEVCLATAELRVLGRMVEASNATLRCQIELGDAVLDCVYKPQRGERPLWDFIEGTLGRREVATYRMASAMGLDCVPITVWRDEGPYGPGMCQMWIDSSTETAVDLVAPNRVPAGWFRIAEGEGSAGERVALIHADRGDLRDLCLLDLVVNNTDRKGGHVLLDSDGRVQGIDHGVTFHHHDKLRTVLWGWSGEELRAVDIERLGIAREHLDAGLLDDWLTTTEIDATRERISRLSQEGVMPEPSGAWPPLPWPAF